MAVASPVVGPRITCIPARDARVAAVLRRGPSGWFRLGCWDVAAGTYTGGSWLRGKVYPDRCDLSPDGRLFCYFALNPGADWPLGWTYIAVSRLPWLHALAAWGTSGTWTRGAYFTDEPGAPSVAAPDHGTLPPSVRLAVSGAHSFAVERRRGWSERPGSEARRSGDMWDERRAQSLVMTKPSPLKPSVLLEVEGGYGAFRSRGYSTEIAYRIVEGPSRIALPSVQWADWDRNGDLLVATDAGELQTRGKLGWLAPDSVVADLAAESPQPAIAPPEARLWP
jgi:hypothetical protein